MALTFPLLSLYLKVILSSRTLYVPSGRVDKQPEGNLLILKCNWVGSGIFIFSVCVLTHSQLGLGKMKEKLESSGRGREKIVAPLPSNKLVYPSLLPRRLLSRQSHIIQPLIHFNLQVAYFLVILSYPTLNSDER